MGSHSLLQGIFLTQGSNQGLLYYRKILYCLNHQGSSNYTPIQINFPSGIPVFWGATTCCNNYFVQPVPSFSFLTGLLLKPAPRCCENEGRASGWIKTVLFYKQGGTFSNIKINNILRYSRKYALHPLHKHIINPLQETFRIKN